MNSPTDHIEHAFADLTTALEDACIPAVKGQSPGLHSADYKVALSETRALLIYALELCSRVDAYLEHK